MSNWEVKRFIDFIKLNRGFDLPNDKMIFGDYPVVASTSIKGMHNKYKVESPCVITGRSGSLGTVQYINKKCTPLNTTLYVKDFKDNDTKFVYYFLQTMHLEEFNSGAGVPTLNQNHLHNIKLNVPDLPTQERIADILSSYDDLIENNNRRIELLEKAAQELYKEWFVRFRFPGHEHSKMVNGIPEGWERNRLSVYYDTTSGGTPSRKNPECFTNGTYPWVKTGEIQDSIILDTEEYITAEAIKKSSAKLLPNNSIIIAMYGVNIGKLAYLNGTMTCNQACCVFKDKKYQSSKHYLFYYLKSIREYLFLISFGAAQQNLSQDLIKKIKITMPPEEIINSFEMKVDKFYDSIKALQQQNQNLKKQRDLLLPRLMSGKLDV